MIDVTDSAKRSKTDEAVDALAEMIRSGRFSVGDKLPTEPELVDELGVSRGALREAVQALAFIGVLRVRQGDGTYVSGLEPSRLLRSVGFALDLSSPETLAELYGVRRILEPVATGLAARAMTATQIDAVRSQLDAMRDAVDAETFVLADAAFHDEIAGACGNEALRALLVSLRSESARERIRRARDDQGATARTVAEHEAILAALEAGDAELAQAAATVHLAEGERWLRRSVEQERETT